MAKLDVRPAELDDVDAIATIHVEAWRAAYRGMLPDAVLDGLSVDARRTQWQGFLTSPSSPRLRHLVLARDAVVSGFAVVGPSRDDDASAAVMELLAIYLHPSRFGFGEGVLLLRAAVGEAQAQGAEALTLWVLDANARARRFYEREGFTLDGAAKHDERLNARELRYRRALSPVR